MSQAQQAALIEAFLEMLAVERGANVCSLFGIMNTGWNGQRGHWVAPQIENPARL